MLNTKYIDAENPKRIIRGVIEKFNLDKIILLKITKKYYSKKVMQDVLEIVLEDYYDIA